MFPTISLKNTLQISGIVGLLFGLMGLSISDIFKTKTENRPVEQITDLSNITLCASLDRFDIDLATATLPVAPKLNPKWKTNLSITSASPEVFDFFNQGLFYLYAFNHAEAERAFKEAIRLDPTCAMCHWGIGIALGPNINMPMSPEKNPDAYQFSQKALSLSEKVSPKEKALIAALSKRYVEEAPESRAALDTLYANEMRLVASRFREDIDVATLFAESLMDLMPWQYWEEDGSPKEHTREVLAILDYIAEKEPNHPGANHYYIHAAEAVHPDLATASADKLTQSDLPAGHLVHMPSHIYIRTGRYHDASVANQNAMKVDEEYIERCNIQGFYPAAYYPHNIHFLWFASSMEGRSKVSIDAARKLITKTPKAMVKIAPRLERYFTIPYFSLIRFGHWNEILQEEKPTDDLQYAQIMWQYAQGMALANTGKIRKAKKVLAKVQSSIENDYIQSANTRRFPTIGLVQVASLVLEAEIAGHKKQFDKKVQLLEEAVAIQDGFSYSEPPYFYYPIRQSLGAALLEDNRPSEAELVYKKDLTFFPDNGWSLYGLQKSLELQNKREAAKGIQQEFEKAWVNADVQLTSSVM